MRYLLWFGLLLGGLCLASPREEAHEKIRDRQYQEAAQMLEQELAQKETEELLYLLGNTHYLAGNYAKSRQFLEQLLQKYPNSSWKSRAQYKIADNYLREKSFQNAYDIYLAQVKRLTADERKATLAQIYLKYANQFFKPEDADTKPDYGKALRLYEEALTLSLAESLENEVFLKKALCLFHLNQYYNAIQILEVLKKRISPESFQKKILEETLFYLGENYFKLGQLGKARLIYKDFLASFPASEFGAKAQYMIIKTYHFPTPANIEDLESGIRASREFLEKYPNHELAPEVRYQIGYACAHLGQYDRAVLEFKQVSTHFAAQEKAKEFVALAEMMIGYAYNNQKKYAEAIQAWNQYLANHPTDKNWNRVQQELINLDYNRANELYEQKKWNDSRVLFTEFLTKHPLDSRVPQVMSMMGQSYFEEKQYESAIVEWNKLVSKFPLTEYSSYAQFAIGETYEQKLFQFENALEAYRKLNWGSYSYRAQQRIQEMKGKSLSVVTERIFYSNEEAQLKVTTRNIECLKVKVYKINLLAYFKKMNTATGLNTLDLALIEPTQTWEHKIPNFEKYRLTEAKLPLPEAFRKPGVYAVNLSSEKLETLTFVVVSNIALILKATRQDILVFAQNMTDKKPAPNVDIYVSDGKKLLFTGKTNAEGFYQIADEKLKTIQDLKIFGFSEGHIASNELPLSSLSYGQGLSPRGYLYSDRPAYRPGEEVHIRGIIREVAESKYHFKEKEIYQVEVSSADGKKLLYTEVALNAYGTFHSRFQLPDGSSLGTYRIKCFQKEKSTFTGSFEVQEYQLERFKLTVEPSKPYYYRGETIEGKIKAAYYYGEPVVNKPITFSLTSQASVTQQSDDKGEVSFSFNTLDYNEKQLLTLNARIDGENVYTEQKIWLATRGFELSLSSLRNVYLTREAFDVEIKATEISGQGLKTALSYEVFHLLTSDNGTVSESKVHQGTFETDSKGNGKIRLHLEKGGNYRLRVQGEDRFKNIISQQYEVYVSGEEDEEKLRILSDSDQFNVGDQGNINIVWRGQPGLALVTYEGERIYHSRLVSLNTGSNTLPLAFNALLSPNFSLGVAIMEANRFSSISKEFKVVRELVVKVKSDQAIYAPGDEMEVTIETTDTQGNGLSAELSLALVDEALLTMFPEKLPPITEFFYGQKRTIHVATNATNTFSYQGISGQIADALLQEEQRVVLSLETENNAPETSSGYTKHSLRSTREAKPSAPGQMRDLEKKMEQLQTLDKASEPQMEELRKEMTQTGDIRYLAGSDSKKQKSKESLSRSARSEFLTTGYWNPSITTEKDGKQKVKVKIPQNTTSWRLVLYGVDPDILVGKAIHTIQVKKDFFIEVKPPKTLVENDHPKPLVVIHNYTQKELLVDVAFETTQADGSSATQQKKVSVKHGVLEELSFALEDAKVGSLTLKASATAEGYQDTEIRTVEVRPLATEITRGIAGIASHSITQKISLPEGKVYQKRDFVLQFGPRLSTILFETQYCRIGGGTVASANGTIALAVLKYLESIGNNAGAEYHNYQEELISSLSQIQVTQNSDGGWGFSGVNEDTARQNLFEKRGSCSSDPQVSALALRLLVLARQKGFKDLDLSIERGLNYLKNAFSQAQSNAEKVVILYTLAIANEADFAYVNRLYRIRHALDPYSLVHLSLIYFQINRPEIGTELAQILSGQDFYSWFNSKEMSGVHPWIRDPVELIARAAQSFIRAKLPKATVEKTVNELMARRGLDFWPSPKGNAAAIEALSEYLGEYKHSQDRYEVQVWVNGTSILSETITGSVPLRKVRIPVFSDQVEVRIELKGNGEFTYQAQLIGWVAGIDDTDKNRYIQLKQHYTPAPLTFKGKEIPRGFDPLSGKYETWTNEVRQLSEGNFTRMVLTPEFQDPNVTEGYLVLEQPIPGGATVLEPTIHGDFENYEIYDGKILFYLGNKSSYGTLQFDLFGFLQGEYQILPPVLRSLFEPYRRSTGDAVRLTIIGRDQKSNDPFKMTPSELYHLGKAHFDENQYDTAYPLLHELFSQYQLEDSYYKETSRMLLYISIEKQNSKEIVKYFEILKERYPQLVIDFGRIIKIGLAYGDIKEFERGFQVFKATIQANFLKEGNVSGVLEEQGEFLSSVQFMEELHQNYPDLPITETAYYSLSQLIYEKADQAERDPKLQEKKMGREELIQEARRLLDNFLNLHPDNPMSDEASFSLANTYLDLAQYQTVIELTSRLVKRFSTSTYLDDFLYIQGYSYFQLRKYPESIQLLNRLIEERFPTSGKELGLSENRYLARYIIGQIYHARGEAKIAIENYKEIQDRFSDAKEAIEFFEQKDLKLKEVSTFKIGEPVAITLTYRNISEIDMKLYKVDLMKLYLLKRNLDQITHIQLAGIEPLASKTLSFSERYQDKEIKIPLEIKEAGAYLVMIKGEELDASGMILISDLKVDVQEDPQSGLVRVNVLNAKTFACESQVHIKVIGSGNSNFTSGESDLRGLFLANNIQGMATVIVQKDEQFGFYRGQKPLQQRRQRTGGSSSGQQLDQMLQEQNKSNRMRSYDSMQKLFKSKQEGVQIELTK